MMNWMKRRLDDFEALALIELSPVERLERRVAELERRLATIEARHPSGSAGART